MFDLWMTRIMTSNEKQDVTTEYTSLKLKFQSDIIITKAHAVALVNNKQKILVNKSLLA